MAERAKPSARVRRPARGAAVRSAFGCSVNRALLRDLLLAFVRPGRRAR